MAAIRTLTRPAAMAALLLVASAGAPGVAAAFADGPGPSDVAKAPTKPKNDAPPELHLLGDWGGVRSRLHDDGVDLSFDYTGQVAADVGGGRTTGVDYAQQLQLSANIDWEKLAGVKGFSTHAILVNRFGDNASSDYVGDNLFQAQSVYGGAGDVAVHLVEIYGEEKLAGGRIDLAGGRLPVGEDFATSPLYCDFMNTAVCGYPHSLPAKVGFTAFPNSTWGARLRVVPVKSVYVQAGAYQVRPQFGGRSGFDWGWSGTTGGYFPVELGYEPVFGDDELPGHYKVGAGYDSSDYPDLFADASGAPFVLSGAPQRIHAGRASGYVLADQMVHRNGDGPANGWIALAGYVRSTESTSQFSRFAFAGLLDQGPLRSRPDDSIGAVVAWAKISDALSATQALQQMLGLPLEDDPVGVQSHETIFEGRYDFALAKGLHLMPDLQYIVRPGAARTYPNATVVALQVKAEF